MIEIIKRTGVFLIIAETLYQFVQENRYARYVRLLIRIMTLALLLLPILDVIKEGSSAFFLQKLEELETAYVEYDHEHTEAEYEGEVEMVLSQCDNNHEVEQYTGTYIKDICNKCIAENGYYIQEVMVREEGIYFRLQVPKSIDEDGINTDTEIRIEPIAPVEEIDISGVVPSNEEHITEADWSTEEQRMQILLSEFLGIAKQMIEVEIHG